MNDKERHVYLMDIERLERESKTALLGTVPDTAMSDRAARQAENVRRMMDSGVPYNSRKVGRAAPILRGVYAEPEPPNEMYEMAIDRRD